jgi:hypothetical protein
VSPAVEPDKAESGFRGIGTLDWVEPDQRKDVEETYYSGFWFNDIPYVLYWQ